MDIHSQYTIRYGNKRASERRDNRKNTECIKIRIFGIVQGVGFRPTVYRVAKKLGLNGFVRNTGACVEIVVDRDERVFLEELRKNIPPLARIERTEILRIPVPKDGLCGFEIDRSAEVGGKRKSETGSTAPIPPDTAICDDCLMELFDRRNRRYLYPFINCTNCGARYSVIEALPYDRENTSMAPFSLCDRCLSEYRNPEDRRLHAQTISCPADGPEYELYTGRGEKIKTDDPIRDFAVRIDRGDIGIAKSWGGMHIICIPSSVKRLRSWYNRPQKPFAIMVKNIDAVKNYADLKRSGKTAAELLRSPERPIVLLKKRYGNRKDYVHRKTAMDFLDEISPGLESIGIYLPYSGFHHVLFHHLKADAVISTSANPKGEPMITRNEEAFRLGLDVCLLHNVEIINRVDDSVVIPYRSNSFFIRKSRGYVPLEMRSPHKETVLSLGALENVTASLSTGGRLYVSQYIGDTRSYGVYNFLDETARHLMKLTGTHAATRIGIDLHPQYPTRRLGKDWADRHGAYLVDVQHHWAHAASLMVDCGIDEEIVALTLDGAGYGTDGTVWGGEVLLCDFHAFRRIGHISPIPLIGGDAAVRDPRRLVFAVHETLGIEDSAFEGDTAETLRKALRNSIPSSGFGRLLDALSCRLGICTSMTYDGEPAMKIEPYLRRPKDCRLHWERQRLNLSANIVNTPDAKCVDTFGLFQQIEEHLKNRTPADLTKTDKNVIAYCVVRETLCALMDIAIDEAKKKGVAKIGLTGGVSYNVHITDIVLELIKKSGLKLLLHNRIPNGDGGISTGQNAVAGLREI